MRGLKRMITITSKGDYRKLEKYLMGLKQAARIEILDKFGKVGVEALSAATPVRTGRTASSWSYTIENGSGYSAIVFENSNVNDGVPIAVILQYGHGTGTGGYVQGRDYINPAVQPVFDKLVNDVWKEITKL